MPAKAASSAGWNHGLGQKLLAKAASLANIKGQAAQAAFNAVQVLAIRVCGAGLTYLSMVFLARWLGPDAFGAYAYVFVLITLIGLAFTGGFASSALRYLAQLQAQGQSGLLAGFLTFSFGFAMSLCLLGAAIIAAALWFLRSHVPAEYLAPMLAGTACIPLWTLQCQLESTSRAFGWTNLAYFPGYIIRPVLIAAGAALLIHLGFALAALTAVWAALAAFVLTIGVQGAIAYRRLRAQLKGVSPVYQANHWSLVSFTFLIIDGFRMLIDNTDIILVGWFLQAHDVAIYYAVIRTSGLIAFVSFSVIAQAVPRFAELFSAHKHHELQSFVTQTARLTFWPTLLAAGGVAAVGPFLLHFFGSDFGAGYRTMLIVLAGLVLRALTMPAEYLLNMTGRHKITAAVYAGTAALTVLLNLLLVPSLGIAGAATASYAAMLSGNLILLLLTRRLIGITALPFAIGPRAA